ncbi:MAG: hypothetical protein RDU13_11500 [Elusimicrobiales bacterium]|nr:hypothetical protein [Elusimicrobiales bacterium]
MENFFKTKQRTVLLAAAGVLLVVVAWWLSSVLSTYIDVFWQDPVPMKSEREIRYDWELGNIVDRCSDSVDCYLYEARREDGYKSVVYLNSGIRIVPKDSRLLVARADARVNNFKNRYSQDLVLAMEDYLDVISGDGDNAAAHTGLCRAAAYATDLDPVAVQQTYSSCKFMLSISSGNAAAVHFYIGLMEMAQGRFEKAIESFSESVRSNPDAEYPDEYGTRLPIYNFRAKAYIGIKDLAAAERDCERAVLKNPNGASLAELAYIQIKIGKRDSARASLDKLMTVDAAEIPNARKQGLEASYRWIFDKDPRSAVAALAVVASASPPKISENFYVEDFMEFLQDLFELPEYKGQYGLSARLRSDSMLIRPKVSFRPAQVTDYRIEGACQRVDISSRSDDWSHYYNDFVITAATVPIRTRAQACSNADLRTLTDFALVDAERRIAVDYDESFNWRTIGKIVSLNPEKCAIFRNPDSTNSLVLLEFSIDAVQPRNEEKYRLFSMVALDDRLLPKKTLLQNVSVETDMDNRRILNVWGICDVNADGLAEVIVSDERYAGYNWNVFRFAPDFSATTSEAFGGFAGHG